LIEGRAANFANNVKSKNRQRKFSSIKTRIDYRGRIYIPVEIRKNLNLKPDNEINLKCEGNTIVLSPAITELWQNDRYRRLFKRKM